MTRRHRRSKPPQTVVRLSSPADLAALVPYLTGFRPVESIVVLSLRGPRQRLGLCLRHDLPDPDHHGLLVDDIVMRVGRDGGSGVAVVVVTEEPDTGDALPRRDLVDRLLARLSEQGLGWVEAILVRDGRWWSYGCVAGCCPPEGTVIPEHPVGAVARYAAESAARGKVVLADREALERSVEGPRGLRLPVLEALFDTTAQVLVNDIRADPDGACRRTLDTLSTAVESAYHGRPGPTDREVARIAVGLLDKRARDDVATWGLDRPPAALLAALSDLVQRTPDDWAAPICTVLGSIAHGLGDGGLANVALSRALRCEPDYTLARLAMQLLQGGVPPETIRRTARATRLQLKRPA